jgi:hypothetical protein
MGSVDQFGQRQMEARACRPSGAQLRQPCVQFCDVTCRAGLRSAWRPLAERWTAARNDEYLSNANCCALCSFARPSISSCVGREAPPQMQSPVRSISRSRCATVAALLFSQAAHKCSSFSLSSEFMTSYVLTNKRYNFWANLACCTPMGAEEGDSAKPRRSTCANSPTLSVSQHATPQCPDRTRAGDHADGAGRP